ncbi:MAG: 4-hydroxy-tetrahydrodipicolinate synthase [Polyangiales bacterium]
MREGALAELTGVVTALVSPMRQGKVDVDALGPLVEAQVQAGVSALITCGTTGESATLSLEEQMQVLDIVREHAAGRTLVLAGAGGAATSKACALAEAAAARGADGLLVVTPYYNRPSPAGLEAHFRALAAATPLPLMLYNVPGRTGVDLDLDTVARLLELDTVVALKEASGGVSRIEQAVARFGRRLSVFSGNDADAFAALAVGAAGVVSVSANVVPQRLARLWAQIAAGAWHDARQLHQSLLPLHDALFWESNPGPVKAALAALGLIAAEIRLPLVWPTETTRHKLAAVLAELDVAADWPKTATWSPT